MSQTTAITKPAGDTRLKSVRDLLERSKGQLAMALPRHLTPERMMRVALTAIQTTPALLDCDPRSVIGAVVQAAQLGLEIGVMGQAYLVPYKRQAQLIVGYRGLLSLARRSGELASFEARIVREGDSFDFCYGTEGKVTHKPSLTGSGRRAVVCAYACAKLRSGEWAFEVMDIQQLEAIRQRSKASFSGPWVTDTEEMYRKTVARRLLKWLPHSIELATAFEAEDRVEVGLPPAGEMIDLPDASPLAELTGRLQDQNAATTSSEPDADEQEEIRQRELAEMREAEQQAAGGREPGSDDGDDGKDAGGVGGGAASSGKSPRDAFRKGR